MGRILYEYTAINDNRTDNRIRRINFIHSKYGATLFFCLIMETRTYTPTETIPEKDSHPSQRGNEPRHMIKRLNPLQSVKVNSQTFLPYTPSGIMFPSTLIKPTIV